jgi:hypothetical protein
MIVVPVSIADARSQAICRPSRDCAVAVRPEKGRRPQGSASETAMVLPDRPCLEHAVPAPSKIQRVIKMASRWIWTRKR